MKKQCQLCKNHFDCYENETCWCNRVEFRPFLFRIPEGVNGCICSNCLIRLPEKNPIQKKKQDYVAGSSVSGLPD